MSDDLPTAALAYAQLGLRVLPLWAVSPLGGCQCPAGTRCGSVAKHPRIKEWQRLATSDEAQVKTWWKAWPDANIGIACGAEILIIDVDVKHGAPGEASLAALEQELGALPATAEAFTPSGGRHLPFRGSVEIRNSQAGKLAAGLDVRGNGGFFVAPPSRTDKGEYEWGPFSSLLDTPLGELPPAWFKRLYSGANGRTANGNGAGAHTTSALPAEIYEGQGRNAQLFSLACGMVARGMSGVEIRDALDSVNYHRCRPPLDTDELSKLIDSALKYPAGATRPAPAPPKEKAAPKANTDTTAPQARPERDAADLLGKQLAPLRWLIPGILPEGLMLLAGKPKMGKSFMALGWIVAMATGGYVLGKTKVEPACSLYLALEDNERRMQDRLRTVLNGATLPRGMFYYEFTWKAMGNGGLKMLDDWLNAHPECRLIVIDTLARVRMDDGGKNGNSYLADYKAITGLQHLALSRRMAIVLIHHLNQGDSEDPMHLISGTSGITGAADGAIVLKRQRGAADAVLWGTHRDIRDNFEYALQWDRDTAAWAIVGEAAEYALSQERQLIIKTIRDMAEPLSPREAADFSGLPYGSVRKMMASMFKEKALDQTAQGKYGLPEWRYARPD